jgi:hypothetical protein
LPKATVKVSGAPAAPSTIQRGGIRMTPVPLRKARSPVAGAAVNAALALTGIGSPGSRAALLGRMQPSMPAPATRV